jgi:hypothetical protein
MRVFKSFDKAYLQTIFLTVPKGFDGVQIFPSLPSLGIVKFIPVPEFIDPRFRENKPKTFVFNHRKRVFWACFRENCVHNFGHWT